MSNKLKFEKWSRSNEFISGKIERTHRKMMLQFLSF
jgi:hypothetical protein